MTKEKEYSFELVNEALVDVFNNVMWIEEASLRESEFNDITIKDMHIIAAIDGKNDVPASKLAEIVHVTPSTMTSAIDKLVKKGYVERHRDETDRRLVMIKLTHKGRIVNRAHDAFHRGLTHALFDQVEQKDTGTIQTAVMALQAYLHQLVE
ncbi:MarR family transcriptional regulator [Weissella diestrammenae]|uniref:MarR family transcriptional regulator n=1 Tax=Weissella diestrammenae TaxID=1162633 RepID=A0A7G9T627_9LACO|nr:MarR family transcriptional regulator [Weissella diestrammenae]MCM0582387.1 MarR family transcriptional regulator [Weissella diestrammenae]QNN75552.1 MarR family transcriptional regulator [Weissella diestrammenae]